MDGVFGLAVAGVVLAGSPGPATLSLAATGAAFGARRGLSYFAGIVVGMVAVMAIIAGGIVGVLLALPGAKPAVTALAALYFLYLAFRIATAPPLSKRQDGSRPSFAAGLFLSLVNPKGYAAMAALFSGFVLVPGRLPLDALAKATVLFAIIAASSLAWLFAGAALTRFLRGSRASRAINVTFAVLLLASLAVTLRF
ncbi:MAG TPA: LysE family transporter [Stellaceae bacterium]|nr:LysE family transporter [Stellaceae bacterium]